MSKSPRDAAIAVAERIEKKLKELEAFKESNAKDYALSAVIKGEEGAAALAKENYAAAKIYESVIKVVNEQLRLELVELSNVDTIPK